MRPHGIAISSENPAEFEEGKHELVSESKFGESGNAQSGYVLRENPKKTWRAVDARPPLLQYKACVCKQCGKGFQSMKALCGHMACHSDKERGAARKDDYLWTSENQKVVFDTQSETEEVEEERTTLRATTRLSKSRRCKRVAEDCSYSPLVLAVDASSAVSEVVGKEQEEMAKCLMMLSRDSLTKFGVNCVVESSGNHSVVVESTKSSSIETRKVKRVDGYAHKKDDGKCVEGETAEMEDSDSGYFLDERAKGESEVSIDWFRSNGGFSEGKRSHVSLKPIKRRGNAYNDDDDEDEMGSKCGGIESRKRKKYGSEDQEYWNESSRIVKNGSAHKKSKYECFTCGKTLKSYQALGGHKPCHKKSNAYGESGENSPNADAAYYKSNAKFVESSSKRKESSAKSSSHIAEKKSKSKKTKVHACPFCDRVFKNGQALGGHKRSHFLTRHDESSSRSVVEKHELLDLNLPAPEANEEEGAGHHFSSW